MRGLFAVYIPGKIEYPKQFQWCSINYETNKTLLNCTIQLMCEDVCLLSYSLLTKGSNTIRYCNILYVDFSILLYCNDFMAIRQLLAAEHGMMCSLRNWISMFHSTYLGSTAVDLKDQNPAEITVDSLLDS